MKSLELVVAKENIAGRDTFLTTYDLLKTAINSPTKEGFNVDEMVKRLRLLEKVEAHKSLFDLGDKFEDSMLDKKATLELEDADFAKLKELFKEMKWGVISKTIIDIHNQLDKQLVNTKSTRAG